MEKLFNKTAVIGIQALTFSVLLTGTSYAIGPEVNPLPEPGPVGLLLLGGLALLIARRIKRDK